MTEQTYSYPSQTTSRNNEELKNLVDLLSKYTDMLPNLRRELRGEDKWKDPKTGDVFWVQTTKPVFVKLDNKTRKPLRRENKLTGRKEYIPNEEAIEEVLRILRSMGVNSITPITSLEENDIIMDLREFEMKLSALLAAKQVEWGLDKEMMPLLKTQLSTMVQDARFVCKNGNLLKAIMRSVQRIEQSIEQPKSTNEYFKGRSPYKR